MPETLQSTRATVIVPTYNESENVEALVRRIGSAMPEAEMLIIDDASQDGTAARARALSRDYPVRVIERTDERGLSTAVVRGLQESESDLCVVMDADLSHPPEMIPALVAAVEQGADVAIGSRYVPGGSIDEWPLLRRIASRCGTAVARPLTSARDPMAGFFCLRRGLLEGVSLRPRGFKILLEILARCKPRQIVELPIHFEDRSEGESKFNHRQRVEYLKQLWRLYRDLNAWPWKLAKFIVTGAAGCAIHLGVLCALVELAGKKPAVGAIAGFAVAMTSNYAINRTWTFRARSTGVLRSYLIYALGALGGLGAQLGVMSALSRMYYVFAASLGIVTGTLFTFLTSHFLAFRNRTKRHVPRSTPHGWSTHDSGEKRSRVPEVGTLAWRHHAGPGGIRSRSPSHS